MTPDPYRYFRIEARELVEALGSAALALERRAADEGDLARMLRQAHTLKGAARVVKHTEIAEAAHAIEDLLVPHRESAAGFPGGDCRKLLGLLDRIGLLLGALGDETARSDGVRAQGEQRTLRASLDELEAVVEGLSEALAAANALESSRHRAGEVRRVVEAAASAPIGGNAVPLAALAEACRTLDLELTEAVERVGREMLQALDLAERLRLLPARSIFPALERVARDAATELGKDVVLRTRGGDIRADGHVLEVMQNALTQAVRNAVAHGIEPTTTRLSRGKPREGEVEIEVALLQSRLSFTCEDDGDGLDETAARRALGQGAAPIEEEEVLRGLMRGGVSTMEGVTEIAGRGIGLEIVREAAERLGGEVILESRRGRGFRVEVTVPASLAALDALVVELGGANVLVPLGAIIETVRVAAHDVSAVGAQQRLLWHGRFIPFIALDALLGQPRAQGVQSAVVVRAAGGPLALGVDRLLGRRNAVIHKLPELCATEPWVAGVTLNEYGDPEMVIDPATLDAETQRGPVVMASAAEPVRILVIDDSLTTRLLEQHILEAAGYEVDTASSGEEALALARERRYGLFLVDVEMPGMDGFTFVEHTRAAPDLSRIPSVLISSRSAQEDVERGIAAGARGYISKDRFDQSELLALVGKVMAAP